MKSSRLRSGFTLIELLVVIAIIAILASILFPVFSQARATARKSACLSNYKQMAVGVLMYIQDYDELFPLGNWTFVNRTPQTEGIDQPWNQSVQPYVRNYQVMRCPADFNAIDETLSLNVQDDGSKATNDFMRQYNWATRADVGLNWQYLSPLDRIDGKWVAIPTDLGRISKPSSTILFIDSIWNRDARGNPVGGGNWMLDPPCFDAVPTRTGRPLVWFGGWEPRNPRAWNVFGGAWPWHNDTVNVAFTDGHIKSLKVAQLLDGVLLRSGGLNFNCRTEAARGASLADTEKYLYDLD